MNTINSVDFENVDITGGFWAERQKINREVTVYAVRDRFEDTGRFEAFSFSWYEGADVLKPHYFWDSDIAKWIESCAFILEKNADKELEDRCDEVIDLIEKHQDTNGYFNIYHTVCEPQNRFKDRNHHELYCLGHFIEAAVAYYNATGKEKLIMLVDKYIDCVIKAFVTEKTAAFVTPGHEEIELALFKLYKLKNNKKYLDLAMFFLNNRGCEKVPLVSDWCRQNYDQSHMPVRQQREAFGHCVRACYLYCGMADAAKETNDSELLSACKDLFSDIVTKKMYISGGIGSSHCGEAFTVAYDLPNETAYNETCAAIALAMFCNRMKDIDFNSKYSDIVERELYNGFLSGVSLDGTAFFYENPLEINLGFRDRHTSVLHGDDRLPITQRKKVFDCSCCPPNVTRFIASLGDYIYSSSNDGIYVHQFITSEACINNALINVKTDYPSNGKVCIVAANGNGKKLYVRVPGWCKNANFSSAYSMHNGYAVFNISSDVFELEADFVMTPVLYSAKSNIIENNSKAAVMYGPVLYCAEQADNSFDIHTFEIYGNTAVDVCYDEYFGCNVLTAAGCVPNDKDGIELYIPVNEAKYTEVKAKLIPYFGFANRGESDMAVWLHLAKRG